MMTLLWTLLGFIVAVSLLVTVHEFGHYWVARKLDFKVLRFSVGFGTPLWKSRRCRSHRVRVRGTAAWRLRQAAR